jgi:hypothetical protein
VWRLVVLQHPCKTATTLSGSIFALCQSAGAVGAVATSTSIGVGVVAGATGVSITAAVCGNHGTTSSDEEQEQNVADEKEDHEDDADETPGSFIQSVQCGC